MLDKIQNNDEFVIDRKPKLWKVEPSSTAKNCKNYIREIVDTLDLQPNPEKPVIALSIGAYYFLKMFVNSFVIAKNFIFIISFLGS